jgi:hypothetical protein
VTSPRKTSANWDVLASSSRYWHPGRLTVSRRCLLHASSTGTRRRPSRGTHHPGLIVLLHPAGHVSSSEDLRAFHRRDAGPGVYYAYIGGGRRLELSLSCPWIQTRFTATVSEMSKPLACRVGRHAWQTEMRRFDDVEAARPVSVCTRCGKADAGGGFNMGPIPHTVDRDGPPDMGSAIGGIGGF